MRIAPLADVKARLSAYLDECGVEGPVVITRNGKAVAVLLVPYDDDDLERLMLARSPRFQALLNRSRQSIKEGKGLSEDAFWEAWAEIGERPDVYAVVWRAEGRAYSSGRDVSELGNRPPGASSIRSSVSRK